jgi:hypothetical protein
MLTSQELAKSSKQTMKGGRTGAGLPGVKTDALQMDPDAYETNRKLAKQIARAVNTLKSDENGPQFLLGWRLYPNKEHPRWQSEQSHSHPKKSGSQQNAWQHEMHSCGCGCGCSSMGGEPKPNRK